MASLADIPPLSPHSNSSDDDQSTSEVVARVTFHSTSCAPTSAKGKKAKVTTTKEVRAKEFRYLFAPTKANYLAFLQTILEKHHISEQTVSDQAVFPCKVQVPPTNKLDVSYIVDFNEYKGLATKIVKRKPTRPIVVFVEMPEVKKAFSKQKKNSVLSASDDEEGDGLGGQGNDTDADENSMGLTKIDYELAHIRRLLEKKYATDHDGTYTYINAATATTIPLTPFMMKEWAHAIYDGITTLSEPPQTVSFDPANHRSSLAPWNCALTGSSGGNTTGTEISPLSAVTSIFSSFASFMQPDHTVTPSTPQLPNKSASSISVSTPPPIFNTPSKLVRFLQAADKHGIPGVLSHHSSLSLKGYGPDIMHLISVSDLIKTGMPPGDAIHLKEYASKWWSEECRCVAKRPRDTDTEHSAASNSASFVDMDATPPNKHLRFEKRFHDGGARTTYGPGIATGTWNVDDYTWWVYSKDMQIYVPLPLDKVPIIPESDDDY